jgi:hypothetical protein
MTKPPDTANASTPAHHLLTVWNPSYADDAMEQHLSLLLERARRAPDERYVWWGKVRSENRLQPQGHEAEIVAIGRAIETDTGDAGEVQLYLTDYRSLYVADVGEIVKELDDDQALAVPGYYTKRQLLCDFWFLLADIRLLVADDLPGVIAELRQLRNVHYHDKPVSLYGGIVDLPLVVTRPDGQRFFDQDERDAVTGGRLWAEWDAEQGSGVAAMERELRENLFGETAWRGLDATARRFIATGEKLYREHRSDPAFDFGPVIGSFAKALEVQCRAALRKALAKAPADVRMTNLNGETVDLLQHRTLTLGQMAHALSKEQRLASAVTTARVDRGWFAGQLPAILSAFTEVRNPGVHEARVDRATATEWRNRLLGIGAEGVFLRMV